MSRIWKIEMSYYDCVATSNPARPPPVKSKQRAPSTCRVTTTYSAIAEGPRDALAQSKSSQLHKKSHLKKACNRRMTLVSLAIIGNCVIARLSCGYHKACTSGREVGALNWTQEHKSIWDGPASKTTGHAPRPARDWPMPKSASVKACARTADHCAVQRSWPVRTFSKSAILHRFPNFYTLRV